MMDKNKQIEDMALMLSEGGCGKECDCIQGDKFNCHLLHSASVLYNAGYRKASDVAREIFEEIERCFCEDTLGDYLIFFMDYQDIKKKYKKGEGNE